MSRALERRPRSRRRASDRAHMRSPQSTQRATAGRTFNRAMRSSASTGPSRVLANPLLTCVLPLCALFGLAVLVASRFSIDAATTPAAPLFTIDTKPAAVKAVNNKKTRAAAAVAASAASSGNKRRRADDDEDAAAADDDAMADVDAGTAAAAAAPALFENDSDDEPTGIVVRNRHQRSAHKPRPTELVSVKEAKRLRLAASIKAEAEAAVAAKPAVFDVWATDREADLVAGIKPVTDARGFRIGRMQQRAFRHHGEEKQKEHLVASTLKNKIHAGASFHPDEQAHQALLRKVSSARQHHELAAHAFALAVSDAHCVAVLLFSFSAPPNRPSRRTKPSAPSLMPSALVSMCPRLRLRPPLLPPRPPPPPRTTRGWTPTPRRSAARTP